MAGVDVAGLSLGELQEEVAEWAAHLSAGTCRWLVLVGELDRRNGWEEEGRRSCAEWLAWRCALTPRAAREHVRVARRIGGLPLIRAAFARGELSYAKVRALTRVAEEGTEEELLELARALTAAQLEQAVRAYRRVTAEQANDLHEQEYLETHWEEDGSLVIRGRLAPEEGALLLQALELARDLLRERAREAAGGSAEPRSGRRVTGAEALAAVAGLALSAESPGRSGGERYQVVVHVDAGALERDGEGGCELEDGPALALETARRLGCDASVVRIREREGVALSVGRKRRTIPPNLRRALQARDRGCRFPGCGNHRFVDAHHIRHWAQGGETSVDNLLLLCRRHHRLVHEGGYTLERLAGGRLRFRGPRGAPVPAVPRPPPGSRQQLLACNRRRGLSIDAQTCASGDGDPLDLELAVDALIQIAG